MPAWTPRLIFLMPAASFLAVAAFVAVREAINVFPASPLVWQFFLALGPIGRDPALALAALPGSSYVAVLAVLLLIVLASAWAAAAENSHRSRFIFSHLALLMLMQPIVRAPSFAASAESVAPGMGWIVQLDAYPVYFTVLGLGVLAACVAAHAGVLRNMLRRIAAARATERRLFAALDAF